MRVSQRWLISIANALGGVATPSAAATPMPETRTATRAPVMTVLNGLNMDVLLRASDSILGGWGAGDGTVACPPTVELSCRSTRRAYEPIERRGMSHAGHLRSPARLGRPRVGHLVDVSAGTKLVVSPR